MSEETDALNNRIRQLENQVADMQRLVQDTSDLLDIARANGLDKFLTGHGLMEYGGGVDRLDSTGIQIKAPQSAGAAAALRFVSSFFTGSASGVPGVALNAYVLTDQHYMALGSANDVSLLGSVGTRQAYNEHIWGSNYIQNGLWAYNHSTNKALIAAFADQSTGEAYVYVDSAAFWLYVTTSDYPFAHDGQMWYRSDIFRPRIRSNGITGNLGVEIQSASAAAIATNGTITTAGVSVARVAPTGAVTGVILAVGTTGGQVCTVVNEAVAANTVTFAASGTSNVADGTSSVIAGLTARRFVWDSGTSLWYPCK